MRKIARKKVSTLQWLPRITYSHSFTDLNPLAFVYSSELPVVQVDATGDLSFKRFEIDLRRRASRRTPLLDSVLSEMEETARELREELKVTSGESSSR